MISFEAKLARTGFSLDVAFEAGPGITALFGPSGSGKSTVIRLLAGLERPQEGRIVIQSETVLDVARGIDVAMHRRRIGLVFQDALLLPHLSVKSNLGYGRWFTPRAERRIGFDPVVAVLGIGHLLSRRPATLSGGERQRVAIGRALLASPRLLLLDEPLASLDAERKLEILPFIEKLRDEFGIPIVYVSHAAEEVVRLAERVVRLEAGRVVAVGTPAEVLSAASIGRAGERFDVVSVIAGRIGRHLPDYGITMIDHPAGAIAVAGRFEPVGGEIRLAIPATSITIGVGRQGHVSDRTVLSGRITGLETDAGPFALATIELAGGDTLKAFATRLATDELGLSVGDEVQALVKAVAIDERGLAGLKVVG